MVATLPMETKLSFSLFRDLPAQRVLVLLSQRSVPMMNDFLEDGPYAPWSSNFAVAGLQKVSDVLTLIKEEDDLAELGIPSGFQRRGLFASLKLIDRAYEKILRSWMETQRLSADCSGGSSQVFAAFARDPSLACAVRAPFN